MPLAGSNSDEARISWVAKSLQSIPRGLRILDAGAGELRLKPFCAHLDYVSQDFANTKAPAMQKHSRPVPGTPHE